MNKKLLSLAMAGIISASTVLQALPVKTFAYDSYERIAGKNRYLTSDYVSKRNSSKTAVLASGERFPDALSAVNISNKYDATTILTDGRSYSVVDILKSRGINKVFLMGGVSSISADLENKIRQEGISVERIAGINRYETSEKAVRRAGYTSVGVASGENYTDALAASALLKQENSGLLLVDGSRGYTVPAGTTVKYTFGGSRTIPQNGGERIYGVSRFETAIKISNKVKNPKSMAVVSGDNFADALSATNLVVSDDAIIMPVQQYPYYDVIRKAREVDKVIFVGGVNSISDETASRIIEKGVNPSVRPSIGDDFNTSELTSEQKELLNDIEDLGNKVVDDIEAVEKLVDQIKDLKPHFEHNKEVLDKIKDLIGKISASGSIDDVIKNIENLEKLIEALKNEIPSSDKIFAKLIELKMKVEHLKKEIHEFKQKIDALLGQVTNKAIEYAIKQLEKIIKKKIDEIIAKIIGGMLGI